MNDELFHVNTFTAVYKFLKSRADTVSSTDKGEELAALEEKEARVGELIRRLEDECIHIRSQIMKRSSPHATQYRHGRVHIWRV